MTFAPVRCALVLIAASCAWQCASAGDAEKVAPKPAPAPAGKPEQTAEKSRLYDDADAGFSIEIPDGYTRLSEADNKEVFRGISEHFGKQIGDRTLRRPPVWFKGSANPARPKMAPPSMAIGYTDLSEAIDVSAKQKYKDNLEQAYKKAGIKFGEIKIDTIRVDGIDSLRIEHDIFSPIDNSRARILNLAVPGDGRRYDIVFNYSGEQDDEVEKAAATVIKTFKLKAAPALDSAAQAKWMRVALFTIGGFVIGVALMMILKVLSGAGEKEPEKSGV